MNKNVWKNSNYCKFQRKNKHCRETQVTKTDTEGDACWDMSVSHMLLTPASAQENKPKQNFAAGVER